MHETRQDGRIFQPQVGVGWVGMREYSDFIKPHWGAVIVGCNGGGGGGGGGEGGAYGVTRVW